MMIRTLLLILTFVAATSVIRAKEAPVNLHDYVKKANIIATCVIQRDNGDGTVTATIISVLKGNPEKSLTIRGETGHCVLEGPVSRFMKPDQKYLVFLFKDNTVGRLGGILEIENDETLLVKYIVGFANTVYHRETETVKLALTEAKRQIAALLAELKMK